MNCVLQRVKYAVCRVEGEISGEIEKGIMVMLGVVSGDTEEDCALFARKIAAMRIFPEEGKGLDRSVADVGGGVLVISNFTLCADCSHGNRPDCTKSESPERAKELYDLLCEELGKYVKRVEKGVFGGHMAIDCECDGPITISINSENLKRRRKA